MKPEPQPAVLSEVLSRGRHAGLCLHLTSLPGPFGIGEIGAAARTFTDFLHHAGVAVWQFLPTGPTAFGDSPYQPLSTFAGNELLVDIGELRDDGLLTTAETGGLAALPDAAVDYAQLIPLKHALLRLAAARLPRLASREQQDALQEFIERNDRAWLHDYALFRVIKAQQEGRPWTDWPGPLRQRTPAALRRVASKHAGEIDAIKVCQFLFAQQWQRLRKHAADRNVSLFGDMPIYIALDSADAWTHPDLLQLDADGRPLRVAGVPPDYFSEDGQLWGNPLYDWARHEATGFHWWTERVRHALAQADFVRIDHFRGFEAYWSIPATDETARDGRWETGPGTKLFDALERVLGRLPVVAEDLGVITPEVDALRERYGMAGMKVLQFELLDDAFRQQDIGEDRVCYTGTHDNDTTRGWFRTLDKDERRRVLDACGGSSRSIHWDLFRLAAGSPARLAIAPVQDCLGLGSAARFNRPGKSGGNWRWRMRPKQLSPALAKAIRGLLTETGRAG